MEVVGKAHVIWMYFRTARCCRRFSGQMIKQVLSPNQILDV
jgi:hypothetical protein